MDQSSPSARCGEVQTPTVRRPRIGGGSEPDITWRTGALAALGQRAGLTSHFGWGNIRELLHRRSTTEWSRRSAPATWLPPHRQPAPECRPSLSRSSQRTVQPRARARGKRTAGGPNHPQIRFRGTDPLKTLDLKIRPQAVEMGVHDGGATAPAVAIALGPQHTHRNEAARGQRSGIRDRR